MDLDNFLHIKYHQWTKVTQYITGKIIVLNIILTGDLIILEELTNKNNFYMYFVVKWYLSYLILKEQESRSHGDVVK